jgi:hypothetical protein
MTVETGGVPVQAATMAGPVYLTLSRRMMLLRIADVLIAESHLTSPCSIICINRLINRVQWYTVLAHSGWLLPREMRTKVSSGFDGDRV